MSAKESHITDLRNRMNDAHLATNDFFKKHHQQMALYHMGAIDGYCAAVSAWDADWYVAAKNEANFLMYTYRKDAK